MVLGISIVLALIVPLMAWSFIDGPTALLFLVGTALVCVCAAMPVVFSVVTRRNDLARIAREEAEEIRIGGGTGGGQARTDQK